MVVPDGSWECNIQSKYINPDSNSGKEKRIKRKGKTEKEAIKNCKQALLSKRVISICASILYYTESCFYFVNKETKLENNNLNNPKDNGNVSNYRFFTLENKKKQK